jgi:hypothetical protein
MKGFVGPRLLFETKQEVWASKNSVLLKDYDEAEERDDIWMVHQITDA